MSLVQCRMDELPFANHTMLCGENLIDVQNIYRKSCAMYILVITENSGEILIRYYFMDNHFSTQVHEVQRAKLGK